MPSTRSKLPVILLLIVLAAGGWYGWGSFTAKSTPTPAPKDMPVSVALAPAVQKNMPVVTEAVGTIVSQQSVGVRARIDSQIVGVLFHDGDFVKAGDILFQLDSKALEAQLNQAQAAMQVDQSQIDNLQRQYDRAKKGVAEGFSSPSVLDDAKAALDARMASVRAGQAAVRNIRTQLDYTVIRAPISGRTGTINGTLGNTVKANDTQPLVTINQLAPIFAQASIPQNQFESILQAMQAGPVRVKASRAGADVAEGTLAYIDNAIDPATGTFVTRSLFKNEDQHLWPGMLVNLSIQTGSEEQALVIPAVALQHDNNGDFVFTVKGGKARKTPVRIGRIQGESAVVADGLSPQDMVVTDGLMTLKDGAAVTAADGKPAIKP